jgi:6-phosphogluconolactonase (cycloisomerase 2 family)
MLRTTALLLAALAAATTAAADCVFINSPGRKNSVVAFAVEGDGVLDEVPGSPFVTGGAGSFGPPTDALAVLGAQLYVIDTGYDTAIPGMIAGFDIQPDCSLTEIAGSPWVSGRQLGGIAALPDRQSLYVSSHYDSRIFHYRVGDDGVPELESSLYLGSGQGPIDLVPTPEGRFLLAAHHTSGSIGVYEVESDGGLLQVPGSPFHQPAMFLAGLSVAADGVHAYAVAPRNTSIHGVRLAPGGAVTPIPGSPWRTVPPPQSSGVRDSELTPDGRFLYVSNADHDTISAYSVAAGGELTELPGSPFPSTIRRPVGLGSSPDGGLLFVLNANLSGFGPCGGNCVAIYRLEDGVPTPVENGLYPIASGRSASVVYRVQAPAK